MAREGAEKLRLRRGAERRFRPLRSEPAGGEQRAADTATSQLGARNDSVCTFLLAAGSGTGGRRQVRGGGSGLGGQGRGGGGGTRQAGEMGLDQCPAPSLRVPGLAGQRES